MKTPFRVNFSILFISMIFIVSMMTLTSCKDIIAENIEGDTPVLIVPYANDTVNQNPVHFKWDPIEGATKYRLEIVSPSFSAIQNFVLDSLIIGTEFYQALDSNEYEVRLTALNAGYTSHTYGPIKFWVGVNPSVVSNAMILSSPVDSFYVNSSYTGPFSWASLADISSYEFSLRHGTDFPTGSVADFQNNFMTSSVNLSNGVSLPEGKYIWGAKAYFTNNSETNFALRKLFVDNTAPNDPSGPFSPLSFVSQGVVNFSWVNGIDGGSIHSPVNSVLQIATDVNFTNIAYTVSVTGSTVSVDMTSDAVGVYYWNVINVDDAENISNYSPTNQFTLN